MNKLIIGILVVLNLIVFYFISRKTEKFQPNLALATPPPGTEHGKGPRDKGSTNALLEFSTEDMKSDPLAETSTYDPNKVQDCSEYNSIETCKDIVFPEFGGKMECVWKENNSSGEGYCKEAEQCEYQTEKSKCNEETVGRECKWISNCEYKGPQDSSKDSCQMIGNDMAECKTAEINGKCQWNPVDGICNNYDCSCKTVDNCDENEYCGFSEQDGNCMNIDAEPGLSLNQCTPPPSIDCYAYQSMDKCVNGINEQYCAWTTECSTNTDPTNNNFKEDCKECALLSNDPRACEANIKCKITDPSVGICQNKNEVTDEGLTAPCDEPVSVGMGLGNGDSTGPDPELLLNKKNCINRVLKTDCEPLNKKYLGEDYETIIKNGMKHQSRCEWIGDTDGLTGEQKVGAQSHHFCDHKEARNCFAYPDFGDKCNQTKECALGYIPSKKEFEELKDLAYDSGLLEQKITELVNQAERFEYGKKCLPKDYINFIKCKLANEANSYQDRKNKCSPKNNCSFVDGFCKVWKPETTTAVAGPIPDSAPMISPMIPTRTGKTNSEALKQFSEDTGCLLYNEPASDRIQCKPSPYMSSTMAPQPETTISPDNMPSYSANGELIENPFHQLREIDLILNKF